MDREVLDRPLGQPAGRERPGRSGVATAEHADLEEGAGLLDSGVEDARVGGIGGERRHHNAVVAEIELGPVDPAVDALEEPRRQSLLGVQGDAGIDRRRRYHELVDDAAGGRRAAGARGGPERAAVGGLEDALGGARVEGAGRVRRLGQGEDRVALQPVERRIPGGAGVDALEDAAGAHPGIEDAGVRGIDHQRGDVSPLRPGRLPAVGGEGG